MFIDDLQWGDRDSAALLADLLRPPDPPALLLIGSCRREDTGPSRWFAKLLGSPGSAGCLTDLRELAVDELAREEALTLARRLSSHGFDDGMVEEVATAVARESEGNPFFIGELVRHAHLDSTRFDPDSRRCQVGLADVLAERLRELSTEAHRLLMTVAVFGRPIGEAVACRAADVGESGRAALGQLRACRLIRNSDVEGKPDLFEIYHERIREALVALLHASELRAHHLGLAHVLEAENYPDPEVLAVHFAEAERPVEASGYSARAGDQAIASAGLRPRGGAVPHGPRAGRLGVRRFERGTGSGSAMRWPTPVAGQRQPANTWPPRINRPSRSTSGVVRPSST